MPTIEYDRNIDVAMMIVARFFSERYPRQNVSISVSADIGHAPKYTESVKWCASIDNRETIIANNYVELIIELDKQHSPESKKKKAGELRKQADALEAEAMAEEQPQHTGYPYSS